MNLAKWIHPQHLDLDGKLNLAPFAKSELEAGIILDCFLKDEILERLRCFLRTEAIFETRFRLYNREEVSAEEYFSHAEEKRLFQLSVLKEAKPECRMSLNWLTFLRFMHDYEHEMGSLLEDIMGMPLGKGNGITHVIRKQDSLKPHSDKIPGRRICTILYLSDTWESRYGADLVMFNAEQQVINRIEHRPNRLVIFSVDRQTSHYVSPLTQFADGMDRRSTVFWFCDREDNCNPDD